MLRTTEIKKINNAGVVKSVDTENLKFSAVWYAGSSPATRTI